MEFKMTSRWMLPTFSVTAAEKYLVKTRQWSWEAVQWFFFPFLSFFFSKWSWFHLQWSRLLFNLSVPFHHDNYCFTIVHFKLKRNGKICLLAVTIVLRDNIIIQTQFCWTFGENHFARSGLDMTVCWAARQLLVDSPPGEQLWSTLWGLNYSFRMATCIQLPSDCGKDFASRSSALLDSLSAHSASFQSMKNTFHRSSNSLKTRQ